jgi:3-hydroxyacyl-CoA dehydrogenase/enoyl-CoA hydratase/3-hydroxybutyryl-CoA epimerase
MQDVTLHRQDGVVTVSLSGDPRLDLARTRRLADTLRLLADDPDVRLIVLQSTAPAGFGSGWRPWTEPPADADSLALAAAGQKLTTLLAEMPAVTVAELHGDCLGPAFELALACDYRIALATARSRIGLPEAAVGLFPAWGGVERLVRRVGAAGATRWLSNPVVLNARQAEACGLVDRTLTERRARIERRTIVDWLLRNGRKQPRVGWWRRHRNAARLAKLVPPREAVTQVTIRTLVEAATRSPGEGRAAERTWFARAATAPMVLAHFAIEQSASGEPRLPCHPQRPIPTFPHVIALDTVDPPLVRLAALASLKGAQLIVTPTANDAIRATLTTMKRDGRADAGELDAAGKRIHITDDECGMGRADWLLAGRETVDSLEPFVPPRCLVSIAGDVVEPHQTNASRPGRIVGLRQEAMWQSPGTVPFFEVAIGPETESDAAATAIRWLGHLGSPAIACGERPGLTVRRVLAAYFDEAIRLTAEGISPKALDAASRATGSAEGPFERMDRIGFPALVGGVRRLLPLVAAGIAGGGRGFYRHSLLGRRSENPVAQFLLWDSRMQTVEGIRQSPAAIDLLPPKQQLLVAVERLGLRVLNEAVTCLADDGIAGPAEIDLAITRGAGLLAGHGGPLRHADRIGAKIMAVRMLALAKLYGPRFNPHPELLRRATLGDGFYDRTPDAEMVYRQLHAA